MSAENEIGQYLNLQSCRHGKFLYNRHDNFIGRSLAVYGEWCEAEMQLFNLILKPGMVVIDVGANIGTHTVYFAKKVAPGGSVIAIEPQRQIFQILNANVALNELLNVDCILAAAGHERGTFEVPVVDPSEPNNSGAVSLVEKRQFATIGSSLANVIRLDDLQLPACHFIKIDVEGFEEGVLKGATDLIQKHRPFLFVECKDPATSPAVLQTLFAQNYKCYWYIRSYFNPNNFLQNSENVFEGIQPEANVLCIPAENNMPVELEPVTGADDNWQKGAERINQRLAGKTS